MRPPLGSRCGKTWFLGNFRTPKGLLFTQNIFHFSAHLEPPEPPCYSKSTAPLALSFALSLLSAYVSCVVLLLRPRDFLDWLEWRNGE